MHALSDAGEIAAAVQRARVFELLRQEELELGPDPSVAAYAAELRRRLSDPGHSAIETPPPAPAPAEPPVTAGTDATVPPRSHGWWGVGLAAAAALALVTVSLVAAHRRAIPAPYDGTAGPRVVVLGAFRTSDSSLGFAVREAVRAELDNTPGLRVLGGGQLATALDRMELPPNAALTEPVATELAQRQAAALAVVGSVTPVGGGAQIVVRLIEGATGRTVATLSERPATAAAVLPSLTRLSRGVADRARGVSTDRSADPLPAVTTSSLAALRDYAVARRALGRFDRITALQAVDAALEEDSLFALARYLKADLLWFADHQRQAERQFTAALALSAQLPLRERLVVRARYEQLVADRTDSSLAYWSLLRDHDPDQPLAYEGMAWSYRAEGRWTEAAAVADTAMALDSSTVTPSATNRVYALLSHGDTTAAQITATAVAARCPWLPIETRFKVALIRGDWSGALAAADDADSADLKEAPALRHVALLGLGRTAEAATQLRRVGQLLPHAQFYPRAMLLGGWFALQRGDRAEGSADASAALRWVEQADLSTPAIARLTERAAELAAWAGDTAGIADARRILLRHDAGRGLPSDRLALLAVEAADNFARGRYEEAAQLADQSRREMFFGRALAPLILLEADARAALHDDELAHELYRLLLDVRASAGDDIEAWAAAREVARRKLEARRTGRSAPPRISVDFIAQRLR